MRVVAWESCFDFDLFRLDELQCHLPQLLDIVVIYDRRHVIHDSSVDACAPCAMATSRQTQLSAVSII